MGIAHADSNTPAYTALDRCRGGPPSAKRKEDWRTLEDEGNCLVNSDGCAAEMGSSLDLVPRPSRFLPRLYVQNLVAQDKGNRTVI